MEVSMRHAVVTALTVALSLTLASETASDLSSGPEHRNGYFPTWAADGFAAEVVSQSSDGVTVRLTHDPESAPAGEAGVQTARGVYDVLVRVPDTGRIEAFVRDIDFVGEHTETDDTGDGTSADPGHEDARLGTDRGLSSALGSYVEVSEPSVMRDVRVVSVSFRPMGVARSLTLELRSARDRGRNERARQARLRSPAFERLYGSSILNYTGAVLNYGSRAVGEGLRSVPASRYEEGSPRVVHRGNATAVASDGRPLEGARYLIMVDESMAALAESLVAWKGLKGLLPRVVTPETGIWTRTELRQYIEDAYYNWDIPPEFVLLLGDTELVPTGGGDPKTDNFYAAIEGQDYLLDIIVGRIPADDDEECRLMLAKSMAYERPWLNDDSEWPTSATLVVRQDDDASDEVYYGNTWFAYELMSQAGFSPIDTLFSRNYATASDVYASLAEGKGFLNYRGISGAFWVEPFQVLPWLTTPRWELPIVVSATCLSGDYYGDESLCEYFLEAGDELDPRGCAAFFGTSTAGAGLDLSYKRGYVDEGFFAAALGPARALGEACAAAKLNLYVHFSEREEYEGWNLLGDPELSIWTADSAAAELGHDAFVSVSSESLVVTVTSGGGPVDGASVAVDGMPHFYGVSHTEQSGRAVLPLALAEPGTLVVSATAKNMRPANGRVVVLSSGPFAALAASEVDDSPGGNGDGYASPGETLSVAVALTNLGDATAPDVSALLRSRDEHVTVADSLSLFGDIAQGAQVWGGDPFRVAIADDWPGGYAIPVEIVVSYSDSVRILPLPPLETVTGDLMVKGLRMLDGSPSGNNNGALEPGEVVAVEVTLQNASGNALTSLAGVLTSRNPHVDITSALCSFPDTPSGGLSVNADLPFVVSLSPAAEPGDADLALRVSARSPTYTYAETLNLAGAITAVPALRPTGPDAYGYYAYDSTDTVHAAAPSFEWTELAPPGPGTLLATLGAVDNATENFEAELPTVFYSTLRSDLSICTNGFIMLKSSGASQPGNTPIPTLGGPQALVAPLWDDLDPSAGGSIYKWHDEERHRFIVEYDGVRHAGSELTETFQIVLHDQAFYPTPTGDSPILFLYKEVSDPSACTVGIEHPYETTGLQYLYDGEYGSHAAPLTDGLAVLFTTVPPETLEFPWLVLHEVRVDDTEGGNADSLLNAGEFISLVVELHNRGPDTATDLTLSLSCDAQEIAVLNGTCALPDIPPLGSADNGGSPFVFSVEQALSEAAITFWIDLGDSSNTRQGAIRLDLPAGDAPEQPAARFSLAPCHPNPFRDATRLSFDLPGPGLADVRIYDVAGRLVRSFELSVDETGSREIVWDGRNGDGRLVASGVYFVRLSHGGDSTTRKAVLLR
jgi:hypothetical protein